MIFFFATLFDKAFFHVVMIAFVTLVGFSVQAAPCGEVQFTPEQNIKLPNEKLLIVTHPSTTWDGRFSSKVGMDAAVVFAKRKGIPIVYLEGMNNEETYFFSDCHPTYWVLSGAGQFSFQVNANHVYSVGGHWEACQLQTQIHLMNAWSKKNNVDLKFTQVLDGIYAYGNTFLKTTDPYFDNFNKFIDVVSYRKETDSTKRKLNLLEMMGVIHNVGHEIEYLKRNLPPYEKIHQDYEVRLVVNGKLVELLRKGRDTNPPILIFEFIDTLWESGYAPSKL